MNFQDIFKPLTSFFSSTSTEDSNDLDLEEILDILLEAEEAILSIKEAGSEGSELKKEIISSLMNIQLVLDSSNESSRLSSQIDDLSSDSLMERSIKELVMSRACLNTAIISLDKEDIDKSLNFLDKCVTHLETIAMIFKKDKPEIDDMHMAIASSDLKKIVALADFLDEKGLVKEASVLDEILLTINSNKTYKTTFKKAQEDEVDKLRKKYRSEASEVKTATPEYVEEARKAIETNVKHYKPLEAPLSTRYSPDMPGVSLIRIADGVFQCPVTKKVYDFRIGFTTAKGNKVPGGDVALQSDIIEYDNPASTVFSTRNDVLNSN